MLLPSLRYILPFGNEMLPRLASFTMFVQLALILFNIYEVLKPTVMSLVNALMSLASGCCSWCRATETYEKAGIAVGEVSEGRIIRIRLPHTFEPPHR